MLIKLDPQIVDNVAAAWNAFFPRRNPNDEKKMIDDFIKEFYNYYRTEDVENQWGVFYRTNIFHSQKFKSPFNDDNGNSITAGAVVDYWYSPGCENNIKDQFIRSDEKPRISNRERARVRREVRAKIKKATDSFNENLLKIFTLDDTTDPISKIVIKKIFFEKYPKQIGLIPWSYFEKIKSHLPSDVKSELKPDINNNNITSRHFYLKLVP